MLARSLALVAVLSLPAALASETLPPVGSGELLTRVPGGWRSLVSSEIALDVEISGPLVRAEVRQSFRNDGAETIEALYVLPLPEGAAVDDLTLAIGDRTIRGEIQERQRARRSFDQARRSGRKAALVEQQRPNLFTTAVTHVGPGETVVVRIALTDRAEFRDGRYDWRFPTTFTAPYGAPGRAAALPASAHVAGASAPPLAISLRFRDGAEAIGSSGFAFDWSVEGGDRVGRLADARPERDLTIGWEPARTAGGWLERGEEATYALVTLVPPPDETVELGLATDTLFVIDVSGSMEGRPMVDAAEALVAALGRQRAEDRFSVIAFNNRYVHFSEELLAGEVETVEAARRWVRALRAGGGTSIAPALAEAYRMLGVAGGSREARIVFLTDGAISDVATVVDLAASHRDIRIHALGIGAAPNGHLMRKVTRLGRGHCAFLDSGAALGERLARFLEQLDRPLVTDLELEWAGAQPTEVFPARLPDLHGGAPVTLLARFDGGRVADGVALAGHARGGAFRVDAALGGARAVERDAGIGRLWARDKVRSLLDSLHDGVDRDWVRAEVVAVALEHRLVTPYTSLVAVEELPTSAGDPRGVRVPNALPRGGTLDPLKRLTIVLLLALAWVAWRGR